jgi:hypothetical protein
MPTTHADDQGAADGAGGCCGRVFLLDAFARGTPLKTFLRKLALLNGAGMSAIMLLGLVFRLARLAAGQVQLSPAFIGWIFTVVVVIASSMGPYFYAKKTGTVPDAAVVVQLYGGLIAGCLSVMCNPSFPLTAPFASYLIFASVCAMPYVNLFYAAGVVLYVYHTTGYAATATGTEPLFALEGYIRPTLLSVILNNLAGGLMLILPVVGCTVQMRHNAKLLSAASGAAELAANAAVLLSKYDTDGVSEALEEYKASPDAHATLAASYEALVDNLNQYRPHLPNWMLGAAADGIGGEGSDTTNASRRTGRSQKGSTAGGTSESSRAKSRAPSSGETTSVAPATMLSGCPMTNGVAYALVGFSVVQDAVTDGAAAVNHLVDAMHMIATATHCALHSFVGDVAQLSWNAAVRVIQPEVKAARFLARLATAAKGRRGLRVAAAAMAGKAVTHFAGTGRVQALTVSLPWRNALQSCFAVAQRQGAFVVDGSIAAIATHSVHTRAVDVLRFAADENVGSNPSRDVLLHEIVKEHDDDDDEWMYVLDKNGGADPVTAIVKLCEEGQYGAAMAAFEAEAVAVAAEASPMVRRLKERVERMVLEVTPGPFARVVDLYHET